MVCRKDVRTCLQAIFVLVMFCSTALARTITVDDDGPGDFFTVQHAIYYANDGDVVVVQPGTYTGKGNRDIDFLGKAITVRSIDPNDSDISATTIIDCEGTDGDPHRGFTFYSGEGPDSVLAGFSIINGCVGFAKTGAGIDCTNSSPTILNCIITRNSACEIVIGGGIHCGDNSSPTIKNCTISKNSGGGIVCSGSHENSGGSPTIINCTITGNWAHLSNGGISTGRVGSTITNCIVWGNAGGQIIGNVTVSYSNVEGCYSGTGNIDADPLLTPDGHLRADSPCINKGDPNYTPASGEMDIDGELRVHAGRVDIGPDEFTDSDSDGMPDWWERKYFGDANIANPSDDPDKDGRDNITEYNLSGNPLFPTHYYVNPAGNDKWDGLMPIWDGTHGPKATIQAAIDAMPTYEAGTIILATGTYRGTGNRDIDFNRNITVRSTDPYDPYVAALTVIDCQSKGRAFYFHNGVGASAIVLGLTIKNGNAREGGGIMCDNCSPTISHCTITSSSGDWGGGIHCDGGTPTISHCIITNNLAEWGGGGVCCGGGAPKIEHCTIKDNWSGIGNQSSLVGGGGIYCNQCGPTITNSILWGNTTESGKGPEIAMYAGAYTLTILYCDVQDGQAALYGSGFNWGPGNIDEYPYFANAGSGVYYLQSEAGRWDPDSQSWIKDANTSPCIDAGDPMSPIGYEPFPNGGRVNMGAYGGTVEASKSYFGGPVCEAIIAGDINGDCEVDFKDFEIMAFHWLERTRQ